MNKAVKITALAVLAIAVVGACSVASHAKLGVSNPIAAAGGIAQVALLDEDVVEIQGYPKVIIASPDASLEEHMAAEGYAELEDERMGSIRVFATYPGGDFKSYVEDTGNACYSLWKWR